MMKNHALLQNVTLILGLIVAFIGAAVLLGWKLDVPILKSVLPGQITMKANTAFSMILCGSAVAFLSQKLSAFYRYGVLFASFLILIMALLTLFQYVFQSNLGIDELIIVDKTGELNAGRMSPTTAFCFLNISMAIILFAQSIELRSRKILIGAFSTTVVIISGVIFLSYIPKILLNYHIFSSASMGIHTSFAFILLGSSLLILLYNEGNSIWALDKFTTIGCLLGLIAILFISDAYHNFTTQIRKNDEFVIQIQQVIKNIGIISISLASLENSEYHFINTKDNKLINDMVKYKNTIHNTLEKTDVIIPDASDQQLLVIKLKYLIDKRFDLNNKAIKSAKQGALAAFNPLEKMKLTNEMYKTLNNLLIDVDDLFVAHIKKQNVAFYYDFLISPLSVFSVIALLSIGIFISNANLQGRRKINSMRSNLAAIVDSSNDAIISKDLNGIVTSWNISAEKIFGYTAKEMIGNPISILFPADKINEEPDIIRRITNGETIQHFETVRKRKDGKPIHVSITFSPLKDANNKIIGASKIVRDITEHKRLELQLRQSQKMGAVGQLSGGIAHDFNNLLGIIIGNLDLLERNVTGNEEASKRVKTALKAATRGADLTKRLLAFSRQQPLTPKPSDLNSSVNNLIEMAKQILGKDIQIVTELDQSLPLVLVDVAELESALLNLAVNARDAMPDGGKLMVSTQVREIDDKYPLVQTKEIKPGFYAAVSVTDTGHGMSPEVLEHVYEPFFTTKERGKGTGMGLSMVYGFAKQSGGAVKIYSEVGQGTTVTLYLPLCDNVIQPHIEITEFRRPAASSKVLVVDDEPDLLEIAASYLQEMGYEVYQATDGKSALDIFQRTPGIALLMTDVVMPGGMDGVELAKKIRQLKQDIAVIYVSGFPLGKLNGKESPKIEGNFLSKPYQREELINTLRNISNS